MKFTDYLKEKGVNLLWGCSLVVCTKGSADGTFKEGTIYPLYFCKKDCRVVCLFDDAPCDCIVQINVESGRTFLEQPEGGDLEFMFADDYLEGK